MLWGSDGSDGQYGQNQFLIRAVVLGARGVKRGSGTVPEPFFSSDQAQHCTDYGAAEGGVSAIDQEQAAWFGRETVEGRNPGADHE